MPNEQTQTRDELKDLRDANQRYKRQLAEITSNRDFWYQVAKSAEAALAQARDELDAAEAALTSCGSGGIYDTFTGVPDAIEQMAQHIKEERYQRKQNENQ